MYIYIYVLSYLLMCLLLDVIIYIDVLLFKLPLKNLIYSVLGFIYLAMLLINQGYEVTILQATAYIKSIIMQHDDDRL